MYDSTDLFVLEIASRLSYEYNGYYLHHIASENAYGDPEIIPKVSIRSMSNEEIEQDILEIKRELYPKKFCVMTHFYTYDGKRKELANFVKDVCKRNDIPVLDPTEHLGSYSTDLLFSKEAILSHYTPAGHDLIAPVYKRFIESVLHPKATMNSGKKVAVIICGQVRNYWHTLPYTRENVIDTNNADVFCLVDNGQWTPDGYIRYDKDILGSHLCEILGDSLKHLSFEIDHNLEDRCASLNTQMNPENKDINRGNIISQWVAKKKAFEIMEEYAKSNGIVYNTILLLRPDVYYEYVTLPICQPNDIYLTTRCGSITCPWMMDNFYFGGIDAMRIVSFFAYEYGNLAFTQCGRCRDVGSEYRFVMEVQFGLYIMKHKINVRYIAYDIPSRRGERIPGLHPKSNNILNINHVIKYVIDQIRL
jgi:hypothetical protein